MKEKFDKAVNHIRRLIRSQDIRQAPTTAHELIDRYVYAATKRLPLGQRDPAQERIRSVIHEALIAEFPGKEDAIESVEAILMKLGNPSKLNDAGMEEKRYLIGPEFFDLYLTILKIVLAVVAGGLLIALTVKAITDPPSSFWAIAGETLTTIVSGMFGAFTWVTVIFAFLSRYAESGLKAEILNAANEWSTRDLPAIPKTHARIKRSEPIFGLIVHIALFVLFNYAPQIIGFISFESGSSVVIPILNLSNLPSFTLLVNIILFIGILKEIAQLLEGRHTLRLSVGSFIAGLLSVVLVLILINNPLFWNQNFINDLTRVFGSDFADGFNIQRAIGIAHRAIVAVIIAGFVIETATDFYKSFRYNKN